MTFSAYSGSGLKQAITHKPRFDFTDIVDGGNGELRHCVVPADVVRFIPVAMDLEIYTVQSARPARLIGRAGAHAEGEALISVKDIWILILPSHLWRNEHSYIHTSQKMRKFKGLAKESISANINPPEVAGG